MIHILTIKNKTSQMYQTHHTQLSLLLLSTIVTRFFGLSPVLWYCVYVLELLVDADEETDSPLAIGATCMDGTVIIPSDDFADTVG